MLKVQSFATGLAGARRIAVTPAGSVIIVAGRKQLEFQNGELHREVQLDRPPRCVAAASDGRIAVGFYNRCEVRTASDRLLCEFSFPEGALLSDLAVAGDLLFAADAGAKVVWCCNLRTAAMTPISRKARFTGPPEFFKLAVSAVGQNLFVANSGRHRIEQFTPHGEFVRAWGKKSRDADGFAGCCNPVSFALLPDGSFITAERGQPRIKRFTAEGRFDQVMLDSTAFPENAVAAQDDGGLGCSQGGFDIASGNDRRLHSARLRHRQGPHSELTTPGSEDSFQGKDDDECVSREGASWRSQNQHSLPTVTAGR